jgi:peptidyl-prolyl cis-trans isomerase A (cyclophilin A)
MKRAFVIGGLGLLLAAGCKRSPGTEPEKAEQASPKSGEKAGASRPKDPVPTEDDVETIDGYRVIRARTKGGDMTAIRVKPPKGWDIMAAPTEPDPQAETFNLQAALEGLSGKGKLAARIKSGMGSFYCDLYEDKAPKTVANFVGLARGKRKYWDADKLEWTARPYYDGTDFHRVIPGFMIQGGDRTGTGRGGIGYTIADEPHPSLKHDRAGQLCMANRGPNTNEAQIFITEGPAPHLDHSYTIIGQCEPAGLVHRIARVPQQDKNRPITPVVIEQVEIKRVAGGASAWMPEGAKLEARMPTREPPAGRALQVGKDGQPVQRP